jgi:hypothetical protein
MDPEGSNGKKAQRELEGKRRKTFTKWVNYKLRNTPKYVEDLTTDLQDGIILLTLLEVLAPGKEMSGR